MKALIVDDERLARKELIKLLEEHPSIEIVGEAQNADEAEQMITELNPDLLFLDIQEIGALERWPERKQRQVFRRFDDLLRIGRVILHVPVADIIFH